MCACSSLEATFGGSSHVLFLEAEETLSPDEAESLMSALPDFFGQPTG